MLFSKRCPSSFLRPLFTVLVRVFARVFVFTMLVFMLTVQPVTASMTPAGIVITNRAEISWFDTVDGLVKKLYSNVAEITVADLYELDLDKDVARHAQAGQPINLPHRLTNTGNIATAYELQLGSIVSDYGDLENQKIFIDSNGNGSAGPGEPELPVVNCSVSDKTADVSAKSVKQCYLLPTLNAGEIF